MYVVHCQDKPDSAEIRAAARPAHLDYMKGYRDNVVLVGPLLSEDRSAMIGSLLVMNFPDRQALDTFLAGDPYSKAGLFGSVIVHPFKQVLP